VHVLLIRHGRPETVVDAPGIADPGLADLGRWQSARLGDWLACEGIDHVVTSPKRRAIETIQPVCTALGLTNQVIDDLDEIDRRGRTYYPTELLPTEGAALWEKVMAGEWDEIGWDSPEVFNARVLAAWDALIRNPPGERVAVACHGGTIRSILASIAGNPSAGFKIDYASISRVDVAPATDDHPEPFCQITSVNETGHFDGTRTEAVGPMRDGRVVQWPRRRRPLTAPTN
jgi:probable phosphoglycerate mutase